MPDRNASSPGSRGSEERSVPTHKLIPDTRWVLDLGQSRDWTALTILVAAISWHWFEAPINRLKARFEYR